MGKITEAINQLKGYKWVSLTHEVHDKIPYFQMFDPIKKEVATTIDEHGFFAQNVSIVTQYGTHIDAPFHFVKGKRELEDISNKERVLPLYVIHKEQSVEENNDYSLTVDDIKQFEEKNGRIENESFVAFSSGWSNRFDRPEEFYNRDEKGNERTPGWSKEALEFLHEKRNVQAIGHETLNTDSGLDLVKNGSLVAEYYWLSQDKYQVEVLNNLEQIPSTGSAIFIGVPKIKGAAGFSADVFAIVPNE